MVVIRKLHGPHPEFGYRPPENTPVSIEIVGSVAPEEVPKVAGPTRGLWTGLARRAINDHEQGRVTVVKLGSQDDVRRLRNNMADSIRKAGYVLHAVVVDQGKDGIRVFLELHMREVQGG